MNRQKIYDADLQLKDAVAVTASGAAQVASAAKVLNLGGHTPADLVIDTTALDTTDTDETYAVQVQVATDEAFTTPVVSIEIPITAVGRRVVPVHNDVNGTTYPYMRLYHVIAGTTPSINYSAFLSKR